MRLLMGFDELQFSYVDLVFINLDDTMMEWEGNGQRKDCKCKNKIQLDEKTSENQSNEQPNSA